MSDNNSSNKQSWMIPIIVAMITAISGIIIALINKGGNNNQSPEKLPLSTPTPSPSSALTTQPQYIKLIELLAAKKWREADEVTGRMMLEGWFGEEDIAKFPCEKLQTINQLWLQYSNGKFGFTVQKEIYQDLGAMPEVYVEEIWRNFGDRVGWRKEAKWLNSYSNLTFNLNAPKGHLPAYAYRLKWFFEVDEEFKRGGWIRGENYASGEWEIWEVSIRLWKRTNECGL